MAVASVAFVMVLCFCCQRTIPVAAVADDCREPDKQKEPDAWARWKKECPEKTNTATSAWLTSLPPAQKAVVVMRRERESLLSGTGY